MIWILNNTHHSPKIGSVTIMRIFRSFSRSKPSLTIAPKFGKTIEKTLISMVDLQKNIQWWWSSDGKTIEKPSMVPWKQNITIPSLWKNYHRWSLFGFYEHQTVHYNFLTVPVLILNLQLENFFYIFIHNHSNLKLATHSQR